MREALKSIQTAKMKEKFETALRARTRVEKMVVEANDALIGHIDNVTRYLEGRHSRRPIRTPSIG